MSGQVPDLTVEQGLVGAGQIIAAVDEVGRGALAGPVTVGVSFVAPHECSDQPVGLGDSKDVAPALRQALVPLIQDWVVSWGVGSASPSEIDRVGIVAALRLAGQRAYKEASERLSERASEAKAPVVVLLDGVHDWLSTPEPDLFSALASSALDSDGSELGLDAEAADAAPEEASVDLPRVITRAKADRDCASVAAASIMAKTHRDSVMVELSQTHPAYGWESNKGYGSAQHRAAIREHGATEAHRRTWKLL